VRVLSFIVLLVACTPEPAPTQPLASTSSTAPTRSAPAPTNIDARVEFETGPDPDYGEGSSSVRAILVVPALSVRKKLFAVPFPYTCRRGDSDAESGLVVECVGDDNGVARVSMHVEPGHIIVVSSDYARIEKSTDDIPLPAGATATVFAPLKYPKAN